MATQQRSFWQRLIGLLPRRWQRWRGESDDSNGYPVSPLDLFDGQKGIEHSIYGLLAAWRRTRSRYPGGGSPPPPGQTASRDHVRDLARLLEQWNPFAQAIFSALRSYVLADQGLHVELSVREGVEPTGSDEMLLSVAQEYLDEFMDTGDWWNRERELYTRCHRDGEGILRFFAGRDGVRVRFVEPEWVVSPDTSPEWSEGVRTDPEDAETLEAIWVQTGATPSDGEEVLASEIYMIKSNVDACMKRGLSDFASISSLVIKSLECLSSMIGAEGIRQGIVMITHHEQSAPADLDAFVAGQTDYIDRLGVGSPGGTNREVPTQAVSGVREVHLTGAQKLAALPSTGVVADATGAINTALLSVGSRYHMPLWVISGDASRNNALDLQAEGPFGRYIKDEQAWFARHVRAILWRVLEIGVDRGEVPAEALEALDLHVTAERATEQRDPTKETERNLMLFNAGLMGRPTWASREGLDFEQEQDDLRRFGGPPAAPAVTVPTGMKAAPPGTLPQQSVNGATGNGGTHV